MINKYFVSQNYRYTFCAILPLINIPEAVALPSNMGAGPIVFLRYAHSRPPGYRRDNYPLSTPRGEGVNKFAASKFVWG